MYALLIKKTLPHLQPL